MDESDEPKKTALAQASADVTLVNTMGGRVHVRRNETAQVTPHGQIVFFADFLATAGVFDRRAEACPLQQSSPNASRPHDVLGTLMLGILEGSKRYAYITGIRGNALAAKALGGWRQLPWPAIEDSIKLSGWSKTRRVVVLRRRIKNDLAVTARIDAHHGAGQALRVVLPQRCQHQGEPWRENRLPGRHAQRGGRDAGRVTPR